MFKKIVTYIVLCFLVMEVPAQTYKMRSLEELINKKEPAWAELKPLIKKAKNKVKILPRDKTRADSALYKAQITTRSPLGALVYETGGLLINGGWIRILGSGSKKLDRSLMEWNKGKTFKNDFDGLPYVLVADDVLGGFYAVNSGGGIDTAGIAKVFYLSPDNLLWENTGLSYTEFLNFCFNGDLEKYYEGFYWEGWKKDLKKINGNQGMSFFPFLWSKEGEDINKVSRKIVPINELWLLYNDQQRQIITGGK